MSCQLASHLPSLWLQVEDSGRGDGRTSLARMNTSSNNTDTYVQSVYSATMDKSTVMSSGFPPAGQEKQARICKSGRYMVQIKMLQIAHENLEGLNNDWRVNIRTSNIQAIITGKLCKWGHIVGVVGKVMSLLCNALCSLQDAIIAGGLKRSHSKKNYIWEMMFSG